MVMKKSSADRSCGHSFASMSYRLLPLILILRFSTVYGLPAECREMLSCAVKQGCVDIPWLIGKMENANISAEMYNDLDTAINYSCIFTLGCPRECTACPMCHTAKLQVIEVLAGKKTKEGKCPDLTSCAMDCVAKAGSNMSTINHCLRRKCAFYCFNGSCPRCAVFITKLFNQVCISGAIRDKVRGFQGQCPELFKAIVHAKFQEQFDNEQKNETVKRRLVRDST
ncbi:hypothetical protein V3C99_016777 [Haemonchus contortus]